MKLLVDANLSPRWVNLFESCGWQSIHWSSVGVGDSPDTTIMRFAAQNDYIVITQDLDYGMILAATRMYKPSVIQLRTQDTNPDVTGPHVVNAVLEFADALVQGALLTVDTRGYATTRLTLLPIRQKH